MTELEWVERDIANLHGRIRLARWALNDPTLSAVRRDRERARIHLYRRYLADLMMKRVGLQTVTRD